MHNTLTNHRPITYLVYFIFTTMPLLFGAVHPVISGGYVALMLAGCGGWLTFTGNFRQLRRPTLFEIIPLILICYILIQTIPLPFHVVEILSPHRAQAVEMINELAKTHLEFAPLSYNSNFGLYRSFFFLGLLFYYFTLRKLLFASPTFRRNIVFCLISLGCIESFYGILQFVKPEIGILWLPLYERAAHGTIIYKNQYASFLNMIWPLAVGLGAYHYIRGSKAERSVKRKQSSNYTLWGPLLLFAAMMMILAILFSLSRGGTGAMICILFLLILTLPFSRRKKIAFFSIFLGLIIGYTGLLGFETLIHRFSTIDTSGIARINVYKASIPMFIDHWLTGAGFGSYTFLSPIYLKGFPENIHYDSAHNEFIEALIELGLPIALLLFIWITGGITKLTKELAIFSRNLTTDYENKVIRVASLCSLVGFMIHGLVDFGWRLPVNLLYCTTLIALCTTKSKTRRAAIT